MEGLCRKFMSYLIIFVTILLTCNNRMILADTPNVISQIKFIAEQPLTMNMSSTREFAVMVKFNRDALPARGADFVAITFTTKTLTPQFNILSLDTASTRFTVARKQLESTNYMLLVSPKLHANYIGRAALQLNSVELIDSITRKSTIVQLPKYLYTLPITIVQFEGVWGLIFIVSVTLLIVISYINLGAQLDQENMRSMVKKPKTLILGSIISVLVMPAIAWFVGMYFFRNQPLYRMGSFIFAAGPAASASTLWTVMLNSDKELSVGLQVISTVAALITMPLFLYFMESSLDLNRELHHPINVPYMRLIQALLVLSIALIAGWRIGQNKRAQEISSKIFRPLVFSVLIFIIVFSTILYWHIYQMFDWSMTLASLIITMATYLISALLAYLINRDLDHSVAISITSAYKNSGIAFAVLLVAFEPPDTYIAYVPCLTQVVTTSLTLYLTYAILTLVNYLRRRDQPDPIQATANETEAERTSSTYDSKTANANTSGDVEDDEFIAMSVTDIEPESLRSGAGRKTSEPGEGAEQITVKVVGSDDNDGTNHQPV